MAKNYASPLFHKINAHYKNIFQIYTKHFAMESFSPKENKIKFVCKNFALSFLFSPYKYFGLNRKYSLMFYIFT